MAVTLATLRDLATLPFDEIIDVRAPSEFAEDHIPGAINLPVLNDAERARVGTIYVRQDRFLARKIGAALVSRNAAAHLEGPLADRPGGWRPLVYCWRGGQRSGSFSTILGQIGWRVDTVAGGYKAYRKLVVDALYEAELSLDIVLIDGGTGTAKTQLLDQLRTLGAQVIDLEGLAHHRGSNFGGRGAQPTQKMFESRLARELTALDPARPVFLEAESNKIGTILIPRALWAAMRQARLAVITAPLAARARHLVTAYPDLTEDSALLAERLDSLRPYHAGEQVAAWHDLARAGSYQTLAAELIEAHYDRKYKHATRGGHVPFLTLDLSDLEWGTLADAAKRLLTAV